MRNGDELSFEHAEVKYMVEKSRRQCYKLV